MIKKEKFLIAHRGNINGPDKENENSYYSINFALKMGFEVEIDLRFYNSKLYIGHDIAQNELDFKKISNISKVWFHCKDIESIEIIRKKNIKKFFYHETDKIALTSNGYFWTYPGRKITNNSIIVMPEKANYGKNDFHYCAGICSDFISRYKND
tara:strand:- start:1665 stop:2126 length:462 start_codon:yes stop_codon:yes gene_type:complete